MNRRSFLASSLAAGTLAACAPDPNATPYYAPHEVHVTPANAPNLIGRWEGTYTPVRDGAGEGGQTVMEITHIEGTLAKGRMSWARNGEVWQEENVSIAFGLASHIMLQLAHADLMRVGPEGTAEHYIEAEMLLNDGQTYLVHISRSDADFSES